MEIEEVFDLHHQFTLYLKRSQLDIENMHAVQFAERKRAFFGGCMGMILLMRDEVSRFPPEVQIQICTDMLVQISKFWEGEINKLNQS